MEKAEERAKYGDSAEELSAMLQEIRDRVRARHPNGTAPGDIPVPSLLPLLHARDAAEAKVASIGTVNPRPPGLLNGVAQSVKRLAARALDWHVREQVEFNRGVMNCIQAALETLTDCKRSIAALNREAEELKDIRRHWAQWREEWERKLASTEIHFLRSVSDLQGAWQYRFNELEARHCDQMKALHADYLGALDRSGIQIQQRLWADLERMRGDYDKLIHTEIRLLRQKASLPRPEFTSSPPGPAAPGDSFTIDWLKFADRFRGTEDYVKRHGQLYAERFAGCPEVLDLGCGRGELLQILNDAGIPASGIDLNEECAALCCERGLEAEKADLFEYLAELPDDSLGGVICSQVVEHLPPARLPDLAALIQSKLRQGGVVAIETPNPECLAIFASHFYLDPTHTRPVPAALLAFYLEEAGFGRIDIVRLEPAIGSMPSLASLPEDFRRDFFGALDYAIFARKL